MRMLPQSHPIKFQWPGCPPELIPSAAPLAPAGLGGRVLFPSLAESRALPPQFPCLATSLRTCLQRCLPNAAPRTRVGPALPRILQIWKCRHGGPTERMSIPSLATDLQGFFFQMRKSGPGRAGFPAFSKFGNSYHAGPAAGFFAGASLAVLVDRALWSRHQPSHPPFCHGLAYLWPGPGKVLRGAELTERQSPCESMAVSRAMFLAPGYMRPSPKF